LFIFVEINDDDDDSDAFDLLTGHWLGHPACEESNWSNVQIEKASRQNSRV